MKVARALAGCGDERVWPAEEGRDRKYQQFIDKVLWGGFLQYSDGLNKYGVRKSLFYYSPADVPGFQYDSSLNWTSWTSWKRAKLNRSVVATTIRMWWRRTGPCIAWRAITRPGHQSSVGLVSRSGLSDHKVHFQSWPEWPAPGRLG